MTAYAWGYSGAEDGLPQSDDRRLYIQITQKNRHDLQQVQECLERIGVGCGRIHNPSIRVDPDYWRFYVGASSHVVFVGRVGSWHPSSAAYLQR